MNMARFGCWVMTSYSAAKSKSTARMEGRERKQKTFNLNLSASILKEQGGMCSFSAKWQHLIVSL